MADEAARPTWDVPAQPAPAPRPAFPAEAPAQAPPASPAAPPAPPEQAEQGVGGPPDEPVRPSWSEPPARRRGPDLRLVIPVLIGVVSVTGAVVTWRSALASEKATDHDRQAIAESVQVFQADADVEIVVQDAIVRFSEHAAALVNAELLDADAERFRSIGNVAAAESAEIEAVEDRAVARRVLEGASVALDPYVDADAEDPFFDSARLRADLREAVGRELQVDPAQTEAEANRLRDESQRLDGWLIALVGAVVLLTFGQVSRSRGLKLGFLGAGTAVWIVATVMVVMG